MPTKKIETFRATGIIAKSKECTRTLISLRRSIKSPRSFVIIRIKQTTKPLFSQSHEKPRRGLVVATEEVVKRPWISRLVPDHDIYTVAERKFKKFALEQNYHL